MSRRSALVRARPSLPTPQPTVSWDLTSLASFMGYDLPTRVAATPANIVGLPAAWACVNRIANAVAQMMTAADAYGADGRTVLTPVPTILERPNAGYDAFVFWKELVSVALMTGNWVGIKADFDRAGYPQQVVPVPTESVHGYVDPDGWTVYEIAGEDYSPEQVVHVRVGLTQPGSPMATGVVEAHRRGLGALLDQQGMAGSVWRDGAVPSGIVKIAKVDVPTKEQAELVQSNWVGNHGGRRTVAVLGERMEFTPLQWSADDAQFLESRQFSVAETALMFGLRPEDIGAVIGGPSMTYGNRQDDSLQRITDAYLPITLPVEQAWSRLIPGRNFVRGNVEALLRSTTKERYELHKLAQDAGIETVDETREIEGKPPLPKPDTPPPPAPEPDEPVDDSEGNDEA